MVPRRGGQGDRAAELLRALIGYGRTWNRCPTYTGGPARLKVYYTVEAKLFRLLAQAEAKPQTLRQLSAELEPIKSEARDPWLYATEIAMLNKLYEQNQAGLLRNDDDQEADKPPKTFLAWIEHLFDRLGLTRKPKTMMLREQIAFLRFYRDAGGRTAGLDKAGDYFSDHLDSPEVSEATHPFHWFAIYMLPKWKAIASHRARIEDRISMLRVALACEIYRLEHGRWPTAVQDINTLRDAASLIPASFPPPTGIKRVPDGVIIYWGEPKDPNNIQVEDLRPDDGPPTLAPDRGIRLWDPAYRR